MDPNEYGPRLGRRRFLQATAVLAGGVTMTGTVPIASGQEDDTASWFGNVSNYDGVIDERGQSRVAVTVGASGNGGAFAYEPAAIRIDPGTTVTWEWTGEGGSHDVAAEDGAYQSEMLGDAGDVFEHTFEDEGISKYACTPHKTMGMKGALIAGDEPVPGLEEATAPFVDREPDYGDWFADSDIEGTVDMRGREAVHVQITTDASGTQVLDPPAVHVDPGTDVIWEWSGDAVSIEAADGGYASPEQSSGEWGLRFDGVGISKYTANGNARGAVVVGNVFEGVYDISTTQLAIGGSLVAAFLSPLAFAAFLWSRTNTDRPNGDGTLVGSAKPK